jgi:hypothetical protein
MWASFSRVTLGLARLAEQTSCGQSKAANPLGFLCSSAMPGMCTLLLKIQICPTGWSIPHPQPAKRLAAGPPRSASVMGAAPTSALHSCLGGQSRPMLGHNANAYMDHVIISTCTPTPLTLRPSVIVTFVQMLSSWLMLGAAQMKHPSP